MRGRDSLGRLTSLAEVKVDISTSTSLSLASTSPDFSFNISPEDVPAPLTLPDMSAATSPSNQQPHQDAPPSLRSTHKSSVGQVYPSDPTQTKQSDSNGRNASQDRQGHRKRRHRGHKRRRHRRQSFAAPAQLTAEHDGQSPEGQPQDITATPASPTDTKRSPVYRLGQVGSNLSATSLDSQELLDHRWDICTLICGIAVLIFAVEINRICGPVERAGWRRATGLNLLLNLQSSPPRRHGSMPPVSRVKHSRTKRIVNLMTARHSLSQHRSGIPISSAMALMLLVLSTLPVPAQRRRQSLPDITPIGV